MTPEQQVILATEFQSPSNRVNIPNAAICGPQGECKIMSFNPLVIGSIFQTPEDCAPTGAANTQFQSPSNRVNIPNPNTLLGDPKSFYLRFNPLVIGSIFQTGDHKSPLAAGQRLGFNPLVIGSIFQTMAMDTPVNGDAPVVSIP